MSIIKLSKQMVDPRVLGRTTYKMEHIIYITIAAVIAGAQSWNDISEFGKEKFDFFKERLDGLKSIPRLSSCYNCSYCNVYDMLHLISCSS